MDEEETHTLFNLTYEGKQYVSTIAPSRLPTDNYSFVEIVYDDKMVIHVRGSYVFDGKKEEIILSDLDFFFYLKKLNSTEDTKDREDNEIEFMGVEQPENKEELIFILSVCSYLVYFHFSNLPYDLSLDLLDNNAIKLFTLNDSKNNLNIVSEAWNTQVITFGKRYFYLFHSKYLSSSSMSSMDFKTTKPLPEPPEEDIKKEDVKEEDIEEGNIKEKDIQEVKALIHEEVSSSEIKEATNKKEIERYIKKTVKKYIEKETKAAIQKIEKEAQEIAKEIKEYKKRFLLDISKQSGTIQKK